jgi:hypothetical protein
MVRLPYIARGAEDRHGDAAHEVEPGRVLQVEQPELAWSGHLSGEPQHHEQHAVFAEQDVVEPALADGVPHAHQRAALADPDLQRLDDLMGLVGGEVVRQAKRDAPEPDRQGEQQNRAERDSAALRDGSRR